MAKGDDSIRRKKNKDNRRKKRQKEPSSVTVSNRVAAIIASKKRRQSGKRRMCQGMCFSVPTPEDPFNERHGKMEFKTKLTKKLVPSRVDDRVAVNKKSVASRKGTPGGNNVNADHQEKEMVKMKDLGKEQTISLTPIGIVGQKNDLKLGKAKMIVKTGDNCAQQGQSFEHSGCPSKFLIMCLNSIQNALRHGGFFNTEEDKPLFVDTWGVEFWKSYSVGKDILETSGTCSTTEQIAWIASTAADSIVRKEKEGLSLISPFLLFLVPSQEKAIKVRSVCKPLKALGIHTVSLHPGASIDHQILGLKSCEPEFLVSTPERLLELVSLKAIDISGVSLLVVDGLETYLKGGCLDNIKSIRQSVSVSPHTVVFNDSLSYASHLAVQNLLGKSIRRLSFNNSITSQSACIIQSVHVCASQEDKSTKVIELLDQACGDQFHLQLSKVLLVVGKDSNSQRLVGAIKSKGYFVSMNSSNSNSKIENCKRRPAVLVLEVEHIDTSDLGEFEVVIISDFVHSVDDYVKILMRMARHTVRGVLHSFFLAAGDAMFVGSLIEILEECGQAVPEALRSLFNSTFMLEH